MNNHDPQTSSELPPGYGMLRVSSREAHEPGHVIFQSDEALIGRYLVAAAAYILFNGEDDASKRLAKDIMLNSDNLTIARFADIASSSKSLQAVLYIRY